MGRYGLFMCPSSSSIADSENGACHGPESAGTGITESPYGACYTEGTAADGLRRLSRLQEAVSPMPPGAWPSTPPLRHSALPRPDRPGSTLRHSRPYSWSPHGGLKYGESSPTRGNGSEAHRRQPAVSEKAGDANGTPFPASRPQRHTPYASSPSSSPIASFGLGGDSGRNANCRYSPYTNAHARRRSGTAAAENPRSEDTMPSVVQAYLRYENRWKDLGSRLGSRLPIELSAVPWPVESNNSPVSLSQWCPVPEELNVTAVSAFILNRLHSSGLAGRKRIQNAIRLYHPDKFQKVLDNLTDGHSRLRAKHAAEAVVRTLNTLLASVTADA